MGRWGGGAEGRKSENGTSSDFGVFVDVGKGPPENDDFGFWSLIVFIVGLTDVFGLALGVVVRPVGTVVSLGDIFWLVVVFIVGLTDVFVALGIVGRPVGAIWLLLGTVVSVSLGDIFLLLVVGGLIALRLWLDGTSPLLFNFGTVVRLGAVFWLLVGYPITLGLLCVR